MKNKILIICVLILVIVMSVCFTACNISTEGSSSKNYKYTTVCYCEFSSGPCSGCEKMTEFYNLDKEVVSMSALDLHVDTHYPHKHLYVCYREEA